MLTLVVPNNKKNGAQVADTYTFLRPIYSATSTMGETLGISHNVFEKVEREKDRKERLKKYEEWQKTKAKKQQKIAEMKAKLKEANSNGSLANVAEPEVCILGLKWF